MAEYIDRKRLKQCFHTNICGGNAYDELIDMQPTADVIERSKIDKAIEEIIKLRKRYPNEDYYDCKHEVLEILKKNIGE